MDLALALPAVEQLFVFQLRHTGIGPNGCVSDKFAKAGVNLFAV